MKKSQSPVAELATLTDELSPLLDKIGKYLQANPSATARYEQARMEAIELLTKKGQFTHSEFSSL